MKNFAIYSKFYDEIYKDKDYENESGFVIKLINKYSEITPQTLLSLGCGTCSYEVIMARKGLKITGLDISTEMLGRADIKIKKAGLESKIKTLKADTRSFKMNQEFDSSMAMFNIIGYQTENDDLENTLKNVYNSLKKGGIFVFDCWYMPAVLKDKPTDRVKTVEINGHKIVRLTKSRLDLPKNIIEINFHVMDILKDKINSETSETHRMRYWSLPELTYFLDKAGFELVKTCNFMDENTSISEDNWNIFAVARKL